MNLRLADLADLPKLKAMYKKIIEHMNQENIPVWDEIYPCEFFQGDIENRRLYVLVEDNEIASAFALCDWNPGADDVKWENKQDKSFYLERFGVNVNYIRKGIGSRMLKKAAALAREKNRKYLRLLVVDINEPAIRLYLKNGFKKVDGSYEERIDDDLILHELGFEIKTSF